MTVAALPQNAVTAVAGITHMWAAELLPVDVVSLELLGVPVQDVAGLTLNFSQIGLFEGCEAQLGHGASGAAVITHADATTTTVAWLCATIGGVFRRLRVRMRRWQCVETGRIWDSGRKHRPKRVSCCAGRRSPWAPEPSLLCL